MGYNVEKLFEDARKLSKVNNKKAYQGNMEMFNSNRYAYLKDLVDAGDDNHRLRHKASVRKLLLHSKSLVRFAVGI